MRPGRGLAHVFVRHGRELGRERQVEVVVHPLHQPDEPLDFVADLLGRDEAVRVVLRELPDARQPREHAGRLVAVQRRLLVKAHRQVAVAVDLAGEGEKVPRAVHGLHAHRVFAGGRTRRVRLDEKHVLPVVLPVPGPLPQRLVVDEGRLHLDVAGGEQHVAHVVRERVVQRRALVEPERGARRPLVKREQPELAPELAVVALLGFLDLREVPLEVLVVQKRDPVDPLHRRVPRVAFPVRVRRARQLERLELAGRRHVRARRRSR